MSNYHCHRSIAKVLPLRPRSSCLHLTQEQLHMLNFLYVLWWCKYNIYRRILLKKHRHYREFNDITLSTVIVTVYNMWSIRNDINRISKINKTQISYRRKFIATDKTVIKCFPFWMSYKVEWCCLLVAVDVVLYIGWWPCFSLFHWN